MVRPKIESLVVEEAQVAVEELMVLVEAEEEAEEEEVVAEVYRPKLRLGPVCHFSSYFPRAFWRVRI